MRVEINVLGPFEFSVAGTSIVPTAGKPRHLLAMLALNAGHVVTTSLLIDELWDQRPPYSAVPTLHTYILQLRRHLARALEDDPECSAKDILVTTDAGYLLNVPWEAVDAAQFDRLAAAGHRAMNTGDYEAAASSLGAALSLWRGPPLQGLPMGPELAIAVTRFEEDRLADLDLRIDAELQLGRHRQLLGELTTLCARHPMMENFTAQSMLAFYRSGRQRQALAIYQTMRDTVVNQFGLDPSRRLRELHQAILSGDPTMDDLSFSPTNGFLPALAA